MTALPDPEAPMDSDEVVQLLWSLYYGKITWLQEVGSGKIKRADHDVYRVKREAMMLKRFHEHYSKKREGEAG